MSRTRLVLIACWLTLFVVPFAHAQTDTLVVEGQKVGIGITTPTSTLHVHRSDGTTKLTVEEVSGTEAERTMMLVQNNGVSKFDVRDSSTDGSTWTFETEGPSFRVNKNGTGGEELIVRNRFDGSGFATLVVNGSVQATNVTFTSSRDLKRDFSTVDPQQVLERLSSLPISEWIFKSETNGRRHIGPVAEDFNQTFGLAGAQGEISLIDANGVALASIQALRAQVAAKDAEIASLKAHDAELAERLARLEAAVAALRP